MENNVDITVDSFTSAEVVDDTLWHHMLTASDTAQVVAADCFNIFVDGVKANTSVAFVVQVLSID